MRYLISILLITFLYACPSMAANVRTTTDTIAPKSQFLGYPIAFYLPETRWGFGAAGFYNFRFRGESSASNPSQFQFSVNYTQNKQIIFTIPFELYLKENRWKAKGEISYFRYVYNFYGIGTDALFEDRETFTATYPRFRMDLLRRYGNIFTGFRFRQDRMKITNQKPGGLLQNNLITGNEGGIISGFGWVFQWDKRNFIYNPNKGFFIDMELFANGKYTGSDFSYRRMSVDASTYFKLAEDHTIAVQCSTATIAGDPIFYDMLYFGSPRVMRGIQDRRFKDRNLMVWQTEYRFPIYRRLQGVSFLSTGTVAPRYSDLFTNVWKFSYGAGLRLVLNKADRVRLRLDYGLTPGEGGAFYATIHDAF